MIAVRSSIILAALLLGGCATPDSLEGQRTVFNNPYVNPQISQSGIGPQCDVAFGRDATCLGMALIHPGNGRRASLGNGETVRLTRAQARILRSRAEVLEQLRTQSASLPPPPQEVPTFAPPSLTP